MYARKLINHRPTATTDKMNNNLLGKPLKTARPWGTTIRSEKTTKKRPLPIFTQTIEPICA